MSGGTVGRLQASTVAVCGSTSSARPCASVSVGSAGVQQHSNELGAGEAGLGTRGPVELGVTHPTRQQTIAHAKVERWSRRISRREVCQRRLVRGRGGSSLAAENEHTGDGGEECRHLPRGEHARPRADQPTATANLSNLTSARPRSVDQGHAAPRALAALRLHWPLYILLAGASREV